MIVAVLAASAGWAGASQVRSEDGIRADPGLQDTITFVARDWAAEFVASGGDGRSIYEIAVKRRQMRRGAKVAPCRGGKRLVGFGGSVVWYMPCKER